MKTDKWLLPVWILIMLALCGCQVEDKKQIEPVEQVDVSVLIDSGDVYGVSVEYCVERKALGGQACSRDPARTRTFAKGEEIGFRFLKQDFQEIEYAGKTFGLIFSVLTEGEGSSPIDILWEWPVQAGGKYVFELTGSREAGYALIPEFECVRTPLSELPEGALT